MKKIFYYYIYIYITLLMLITSFSKLVEYFHFIDITYC